MSAAVVLAWPLVVVAIGWRWRPRRVLVPPAAPAAGRAAPALPPALARVVAPIGAALRRVARRPPDPSTDARVGSVAIVVILLAVLAPVVAFVPVLAAVAGPRLRTRRRARLAAQRVTDELPEVVDLILLAAGAGLPAVPAVAVAADRCHGPVGSALGGARRLVELGAHPDDAFGAAVAELGEPVRPLVAALLGSTRDGTPLEPALARVGEEARTVRRRRAEEAARRVPIKLLFPLVLCTLPAFALLTVVPLLVSALGSLQA